MGQENKIEVNGLGWANQERKGKIEKGFPRRRMSVRRKQNRIIVIMKWQVSCGYN
jgi:hypothetical protein